MHLDTLLAAIAAEEPVTVPEHWAQGRTTFGGLTAAILCQATARNVDPDRDLRSVTIGFVRPLEMGVPFTIELETLASGKTVTIRSAQLIQTGKVRATAQVDYVKPLDSQVVITPFQPPPLTAVGDEVALAGEQLPAFFQHFDNHVATDGIPFRSHAVPELGGWMRFREAPQAITNAHLICMIDSWPPTASPHYEGFKPLSTLSWTMHLTQAASAVSPSDYLGYLAKVSFGQNGLSASDAVIWAPDGRLLARSYQTNIIYG